MDGCVQDHEEANHKPVAVVNGNRFRRVIEIAAWAGEAESASPRLFLLAP